ncbi:hypothetical protein F4680DRAFT_244446 [Xylaria scruposa]|nr:hypothetical protein F4680DRAFT_244446 [Xylaria scruposa]
MSDVMKRDEFILYSYGLAYVLYDGEGVCGATCVFFLAVIYPRESLSVRDFARGVLTESFLGLIHWDGKEIPLWLYGPTKFVSQALILHILLFYLSVNIINQT